jgi:hypothetical protein
MGDNINQPRPVEPIPLSRTFRAVDNVGKESTQGNAEYSEPKRIGPTLDGMKPSTASALADLPEDINPGIRRLVELLTISGFKTVDSGDGETHDYACDLPWPFVAMECSPHIVIGESIRLARRIERLCPGLKHGAIGPGDGPPLGVFTVEACYQPFIRRAFITVDGAADKHLAPQFQGELDKDLVAWLQG